MKYHFLHGVLFACEIHLFLTLKRPGCITMVYFIMLIYMYYEAAKCWVLIYAKYSINGVYLSL